MNPNAVWCDLQVGVGRDGSRVAGGVGWWTMELGCLEFRKERS